MIARSMSWKSRSVIEIGEADALGVSVGGGIEPQDGHARDSGRFRFRFAPDAQASDDMGIEARAAVTFSHLLDDEEVEFGKGQFGRETEGLLQESRIRCGKLLRPDKLQPCRLAVGVLHDADPGQYRRPAGQRRGDLLDDLSHAGRAVAMEARGLFHLAQPHRAHLAETALDRAGDRRVRLDPVHHDDVVGPRRVPVAEDREAVRQFADRIDLHADRDRTVEGGLRHPQRRQKLFLSFRRGAAVASHRVDDEGPGAESLKRRNKRLHESGRWRRSPGCRR